MKKTAVISTIGQDQPGIVETISNWIRALDLNIDDSRMAVLGGEFAIIMAVSGDEELLLELEATLKEKCSQSSLSYIFRMSENQSKDRAAIHEVTVATMDHPGIVNNVSQFFSAQAINIRELQTNSEAAAHTGTPIFNLAMSIEIPSSLDTEELKNQFEAFCEEEDLDGKLHLN